MTRNRRDAAPKSQDLSNAAASGAPEIDDPAVPDYLLRHPDFLVDHPDLLHSLTPPSSVSGTGVVDLQRYMLDHKRREIADLELANEALVQSGRANIAAQRRVHGATLALLEARCFEHLIEIVTTDMTVMLNLDAITLCVEQAEENLPTVRVSGLYQVEAGTVDMLIGPGSDVALRCDVQGDSAIFGPAAGLISSEALIRLSISSGTPPALMAFGSRQLEQFYPGQGTELLTFLAGVVERSIRAWLDLPA